MAARHQVLCINKSDRYDPDKRIKAIGGRNGDDTRWRISQQAAIERLESGKWSFYVTKDGRTVDVIVAVSRFGNKYIKTEADGEQPNNLLSLAECPL